jgi:hypothetical protein
MRFEEQEWWRVEYTGSVMPNLPQFHIRVLLQSHESLREFLSRWPIDCGCHPRLKKDQRGGYSLNGVVSAPVLQEIRDSGQKCEVLRHIAQLSYEGLVGKGDRFDGGRVVPHGLDTTLSRERRP